MTEWLIDKSALARLSVSENPALWAERIERGLVHICVVTRLELGYSARSGADFASIFQLPPVSSLIVANLTPAIEERAHQVQGFLADRGLHRSASLADLLIAATAEASRLTVLHLDKDFDLIAGLTGQEVERLALADG